MKITIEACPDGCEEEVIIRANHLDERVMSLIIALKSDCDRLTASLADGGICQLDINDILYFEAVDERIFAYRENDVAEVKDKLYTLEARYIGTDFIRVSKSMILNLAKVNRFAPYVGGRFEAIMINGEKVIISRQYVPELKKRLGL